MNNQDILMPLFKLRPSFTLTEDRLCELQSAIPEDFRKENLRREIMLDGKL